MNYTKGNWEPIYQYYDTEPKRICLGVGINTKINKGTYTLFICNSLLPDTDEEYIQQQKEIESNMTLISAAPELLNSCKAILKNKINQFGESPELNNDLRNMIENAINKATINK